MMHAILITDTVKDLQSLSSILDKFCDYERMSSGQINIVSKKNKGFLSINFDQNIKNFLDDAEKRNITSHYEESFFFLITFQNYYDFKRLAISLYDYVDFIVDNDFGCLYTREEFFKQANYEDFIKGRLNLDSSCG